MDKNKTRGEDYDSGSLCFLVFTWPNSFQIAVPLILPDQRFLLTFSSCLLTPASFQRSAVLIGTHLVFPQRKITLGVLKLFLDSLDRFFLLLLFYVLLWLPGIENKSGSDCNAELSLAVPCADR